MKAIFNCIDFGNFVAVVQTVVLESCVMYGGRHAERDPTAEDVKLLGFAYGIGSWRFRDHTVIELMGIQETCREQKRFNSNDGLSFVFVPRNIEVLLLNLRATAMWVYTFPARMDFFRVAHSLHSTCKYHACINNEFAVSHKASEKPLPAQRIPIIFHQFKECRTQLKNHCT